MSVTELYEGGSEQFCSHGQRKLQRVDILTGFQWVSRLGYQEVERLFQAEGICAVALK